MASITLHLIEADQLDQLGSETRQFKEKINKMLPKIYRKFTKWKVIIYIAIAIYFTITVSKNDC